MIAAVAAAAAVAVVSSSEFVDTCVEAAAAHSLAAAAGLGF